MAAKSSKNEMLIFGLCSTSDDQLSDPNDESHPKCKKMAPKLSKTSTSNDRPGDLSNESCPKCEKNGHQTIQK